jgi:hypothetical protein
MPRRKYGRLIKPVGTNAGKTAAPRSARSDLPGKQGIAE